MAEIKGYSIQFLGPQHDAARQAFQCDVEELDRYLHVQAGQDARRKIAAPFVLVAEADGAICGYYTLSATHIKLAELPRELAKKLPRYAVMPATLVGRLAVDHRFRKRGFGEYLLMDALARSLRNTREVGAMAVIVDAKDENAARLYTQYGFLPLPASPRRLFLPMKTVERLFKA